MLGTKKSWMWYVAAALLGVVVYAIDSKFDYPACAINHAPVYFCCEIGLDKVVYTRYNRPKGGEFERFYEEGWKKARQVNFPDAFYTPSSPIINYDRPSRMCRVQSVVTKEGKLDETLQCSFEAPNIVFNASIGADSKDFDVFWTSHTNARNNNASFPIGAKCTSLMQRNGKVDENAKSNCVAAFVPQKIVFNTFSEAPLVVVYTIFILCWVSLLLWALLRNMWAQKDTPTTMIMDPNDYTTTTSSTTTTTTAAPSIASGSIAHLMDNGRPLSSSTSSSSSKLLLDRGGPTTPFFPNSSTLAVQQQQQQSYNQFFTGENMMNTTNTTTSINTSLPNSRNDTRTIVQTGYRESNLGKLVLFYFIFTTFQLFPIMIVLILDNNGHFTPKLFDGMNVLIGVFMFCWFISCTWFSFLVIYKEKLNNFFRIRESLDRCEYVHMLKDEPIQIIHMDTSGVSTLIERIERLFVFNFSKNSLLEKEGGYEKTVQVKTLRDGTRYLEFQHVRYLFHKAHGRFVPGYLMDLDLHLDLHQRNPSNNLLQLPVPPVERCMMSTSTMMSTSSLRSMISNSNNGGEREREEEEEQEEQEVEEKQTDGLSVDEYAQRLDHVGYNTMEIELPSVLQSIMNEIFSFFYVYQLMCYYVWYFTGYWYVAFLHCIMIIVAATISLISKRQMLGAVVEMTKIQTSVAVKREGVWMTVRSANIVPGDLVRVAENWIVPSDMIIIKGSTVCDESMLTGESMPVQKFPFSSGHLPTTTTTTTTTTTAAAAGAVAAVAAVVVPPSSSPVLPPPAATVVPPPSSAATAVLPAATATAAEVGPPPPPSAAVLPAAAVATTTTTTTTMTTTTTTNQSNEKKYTLFAGTKTLTSGRNEEILAIVQSTGAQTRRGQLIQSILYPAPMRFKFDEHLKAVMVFLFTWGIFAAYLAMHFLMGNAGLGNKLFAFVYGMFMLSGVLSPLIPVVLTIGHFNASKRLQKLGIFSLNTHAIKLCGKIRVFCFDKTGTITKEGLDYRGCIPVTLDGSSFLHEFDDMTNRLLNPMMKFALASCHAVGSMEGELVGSEVEVKMFHSTQWKLVEKEGQMPIFCSPSGKDQLQIIKRFEFDHHRMCMSVVVRHLTTGSLYVFCKGSYENLLSVSIAASVPLNYTCTAEKLAKEGCYVLGIAFKELPNTMTEEELVTLLGDRYAIETKLSLLGLIMFRNELKPESREAIMKLKSGDVRTVMITGDNAMTACYIARECGMIGVASPVILGDILPDKERPGKNILLWKDIDTDEEFSAREMRDMVALRRPENSFELAVTGKAFEYLVKMGDIELLLLHIRIFSRMTPGGKVECVKQHMAAGAVTGMCGDGGNDCGALRIAHVGVALSDAEASVVSPFTSKTKSVMSTVDLCREGRCTLATSFGGLKFLIMYGFVGCGMRFVMYSNGVFIPEWGFVFQDGLVLVGLSYCITLACPLDELGPQRPTSSLVGPTTLCSIFGQTIIHILFLYNGIHFLTHQSWYCPFNPVDVNLVKWWGLQDSNLGTTLFLMIAPQEMIGAIAYSLGSRFRKSVYRNSALMIYFTFLLVILSYLTLGEPNRFTDQFRIASSTNVIGLPDIPLPMDFRWKLFIIILGNMTTIVLFEWLFILGPVRDYFRTKFHEDILRLRL